MIACSNCSHMNMEGSVFCAECGARLADSGPVDAPQRNGSTFAPAVRGDRSNLPSGGQTPWANLHLLETGHILPLSLQPEFTLGRVSEGQPIVPDIDLSPYDAFASGVSRLHAIVRQEGDGVVIIDLASANGTYVNGTRLTANVEHLLHDGDVIALGRLRIQLLLQTS